MIFISHIVHIHLFGLAKCLIYVSTTCKLILESMNRPSDMCRHCTIKFTIGRFGLPNELSLVFLQDMLIWSFYEKSFDTKVGKDCEGSLWMAKGIGWNGNFRKVVKFFFQEVKSKLKVLNNVIIIAASLIVLNISSSHNFPIFGLQ